MLHPVAVVRQRYESLKAMAPSLKEAERSADDAYFSASRRHDGLEDPDAYLGGLAGAGGLGGLALAGYFSTSGGLPILGLAGLGLVGVAAYFGYKLVRSAFPSFAQRQQNDEALQARRQAWVSLESARSALRGCQSELSRLGELVSVAAFAPVAAGAAVAEDRQAVVLGGVRLRRRD